PPASYRAVHRCKDLESLVSARVLHAVARFVGELAEVYLPGVSGEPEHVDVGAGAKHALACRGEHYAFHLGMLEADALQSVMQLDIYAQVVRIELEPVSGLDFLV